MIPLRSIEGITAWRLKDLPRVALTRPAAEARWRELCAQNPRHFDGPILSVVTFDPDANEVMCRRDRYMRLAVQPRVHTGVQQLSVTAVLTARDEAGREHVLLGRRAQETRIFGGMWEIGPSGGIPAPHASVQELPADAIIAHLSDEVSEEIGLEIEQGEGVAYIRDHVAYSDDLCISCDLGRLEEVGASAANWEYTEVLWLPVDSVSVFDQANAGEIIAATRALFRVLGWVPDEV
jgi:isopentenyldiphosphate isomerase